MIPAKNVKRSGKVDLWDLGPSKDDPNHERWHEMTGPHVVEFFAPDAERAMSVDPKRWVLKLPSGVKPGPEQGRIEQMAAEAMQSQGQADPHFGASA